MRQDMLAFLLPIGLEKRQQSALEDLEGQPVGYSADWQTEQVPQGR